MFVISPDGVPWFSSDRLGMIKGFFGVGKFWQVFFGSLISCLMRHIVPLEIFMAQKFRVALFEGLNFGPGIFLGFDFCPHSILPIT